MSENIIQAMIEVTLKEPDDFLKVRETLTRIGIASRKEKTLFQSCHILHKGTESSTRGLNPTQGD